MSGLGFTSNPQKVPEFDDWDEEVEPMKISSKFDVSISPIGEWFFLI